MGVTNGNAASAATSPPVDVTVQHTFYLDTGLVSGQAYIYLVIPVTSKGYGVASDICIARAM